MNFTKRFIVEPKTKVKLSEYDPGNTLSFKSKKEAAEQMGENLQRLSELQYRMYAEGKQALLIVLQAMDAGGKDGTIRHVMGPWNPQSCRVASFKGPNDVELAHDFLWRIHHNTPRKGEIFIFNRSHYEDVLIVRVHNLVDRKVWSKRYDLINDFERLLTEANVHILKFFLHISKDEQKKRFLSRVNDSTKHWKIVEADLAERQHWDDYFKAYEDVLSKTSTEQAPWFIIPANHKWFRNLAVSEIIQEKLEAMNPQFPAPTADIDHFRELLEKE